MDATLAVSTNRNFALSTSPLPQKFCLFNFCSGLYALSYCRSGGTQHKEQEGHYDKCLGASKQDSAKTLSAYN